MTIVFCVSLEADDLDFLADLDDAALDAAGHDGAAAGDREHVFDRHQERLVDRTLRLRDVRVDRLHQLEDRRRGRAPGRLSSSAISAEPVIDRNVVARELVLREQLAHLELDQLEQLRIVDHVDLVQEHDERRHADLAGEQDVLAGLRHRAVGGRHDQDRAVHLRGAGDHVLHVVGVAGAIDVRVVALLGLVFDVRRRDRDAARLLFRRLVDLVVGGVGRAARLGQNLGDRRRQRRLAMVDVTDRADVAMRLVAIEFFLGHGGLRSILSLKFLKFASGELRLDFLGDRARHLLVVVELHRERGAPLRHRAQVVDVAEHVGSGTIALMTLALPRMSWPWIWPRREFRSPMTEPV